MHMLGGKTTFAAKTRETITRDILREDMDEICAYLGKAGEPGPFHVIPDMLVPSGGDRELADLALDMIRSGDAASADWGCFIAYQRQFGTDFFGLAGAHVREYFEGERAKLEYEGKSLDELKWINIRYGHIPAFREARIPPYTSSPLTPALVDKWWKTVNTKSWRAASLATLKTMWEGASSLLPGRKLVPWETVENFLSDHFELLPVESTCKAEGPQKVGRNGPVRFLRTLLERRGSAGRSDDVLH
jgi:hypothetical protein